MLDGKPEDLIKTSIESFEIQPDLLIIDRINNKSNDLINLRANIANYQKSKNYKLFDKLNQLNVEFERILNDEVSEIIGNDDDLQLDIPVNGGNEGEGKSSKDVLSLINKKINKLDNLKLNIAKNLNDLEQEINLQNLHQKNYKLELLELQKNFESLINLEIKNNENIILRIKLFELIGVKIENEGIIISKTNGIDFLKYDGYSDLFISDYIWDKL